MDRRVRTTAGARSRSEKRRSTDLSAPATGPSACAAAPTTTRCARCELTNCCPSPSTNAIRAAAPSGRIAQGRPTTAIAQVEVARCSASTTRSMDPTWRPRPSADAARGCPGTSGISAIRAPRCRPSWCTRFTRTAAIAICTPRVLGWPVGLAAFTVHRSTRDNFRNQPRVQLDGFSQRARLPALEAAYYALARGY